MPSRRRRRPPALQEPAAYRAALDLYAGELFPRTATRSGRKVGARELRQTVPRAARRACWAPRRTRRARASHRGAAEGDCRGAHPRGGARRLDAPLRPLGPTRAEALAQYERLREALSGSSVREPGAATRRLREEIAAGRFPPHPSRSVPPPGNWQDAGEHNLPAPRTSFVGREREMRRGQADARHDAAPDPHGSGRFGQDAAGPGGGQGPRWRLPGRGVAGGARGALGGSAGAAGGGRALGVQEQPGRRSPTRSLDALRDKEMLLLSWTTASTSWRQRRAGGHSPRLVPAPAGACHQPGASWVCGRVSGWCLPSPCPARMQSLTVEELMATRRCGSSWTAPA